MRKNFSIIHKLNLKYFCLKRWMPFMSVCMQIKIDWISTSFWKVFIFSVSTLHMFCPKQKYHFLDYALIDRRPHTSLGFDLDKAPGLTSPTRGLEQPELGGTAYVSCSVQRFIPPIMWQLGYGLTHLLNHMCVYVEFFSS